MINQFRGKCFFLSNFYPIKIFGYDSVEHAFQSAKSSDKEYKRKIKNAKTAAMAKKIGRTAILRPGWELNKIKIMEFLLREKFKNKELAKALVDTNDEILIEGNYWHDTFWGICYCNRCNGKGQNNLGKLLMKIRQEIVDSMESSK